MRNLILSAAAALAIAAVSVAPSFAMQPIPTTHLTDASSNWNPKVMLENGNPTEDYGFLVPTQFLEITTLKLEGIDHTNVLLNYAGVDRHVTLVPDGRSVVVDFGTFNPAYLPDGGARLLITYSSHRATSVITDVRAATVPITG